MEEVFASFASDCKREKKDVFSMVEGKINEEHRNLSWNSNFCSF